MGERGFGSPTLIGGVDPDPGSYDWGFGSPTPAAWDDTEYDTGFGSPRIELIVEQVAVIMPVTEVPWMPDDGGVVVTVMAQWPSKGPFRVRLRDQSNVAYPLAGGYVHSGNVNTGFDIYVADTSAPDELRFVLPPLPVGLYDIEFLWGIGLGTSAIATKLLDVVFRNRSMPTYRIRGRFPQEWKTGPISPKRDERP